MTRARDLSRLANSNAFSVDASNRVGIGSTTPRADLDVDGNILVGSDISIQSGIVTANTFNGNITGVAATFTGNVSIAGTLTYEDVTNVDSIGLITARSGIVLTGGDITLGTGVTVSGATANTFNLSTNGTGRLFIDADGNVDISASGALTLPVGDTTERPGTPAAGMIRYNTDGDYVEYYDEGGTQWTPVGFSGQVYATGGTVTEINQGGTSYRVHTFTSTGTSSFTVLRGGLVEYLVIGGGGGALKGGGGAGGYRCSVPGESSGGGASAEDPLFVSPQVYTITVGAGGTTGPGTANSGGDSIFSTITALGGGRADSDSGGSGGGAGESSFSILPGGAGTTGQGYAGGSNAFTSSPFPTGGGGGASEVGQDGQSSTQAGAGGDGVSSSITGSAVTRGGGGGGGIRSGGTGGAGGAGGGGAGTAGVQNGNSGTANTGGGGGGGGLASVSCIGGTGGSGIVIIRYRIS